MKPANRLRELDFLRGIAIILVIFRHQLLFDFLKTMGWIGVDLFFVLSGFLVSGLLFKEHLKFGSINPKLFLIRRGFKIYPIYYLSLVIYILPKLFFNKVEFQKTVYDLIFVQNYALGWGYLYRPSWSLAVEEHFYFGLAFLLWFIFNKKIISFKGNINGISNFEKFILLILFATLVMRFVSNSFYTEDIRQFTMTHLRIDSLFFGVLIAYWYHFKQEKLVTFYHNHQSILLIFAFSILSFTPFVEPINSFFVKTIGFTLLFMAFGILLVHFLVNKKVNRQINNIFTKKGADFVSKIGFCSYSIYVIHTFIIMCVNILHFKNRFLSFAIVFFGSVFIGFVMTYAVEKFFLNYRDRFFPNRIV